MLRGTRGRCSKRTPGYVFWRQSTLVELEKTKRNYLLTERPVPVADIARRMVRVKSRYLDTNDFHEQNLLRGEYKYFSGKLCDLRHARLEDMVAYVECGSFFGFWDTAQMDRVMEELLLKLTELGPVELVHLFTALPPLRKQSTALYKYVARALVDVVPELALEECIRVAAACDAGVPDELVYNLMQAIEPEVARGGLTAARAVELMDTFGTCTPSAQRQFDLLFDALKQAAVAGMAELSAMDVAVMCTALKLRDALDTVTEANAVRAFLSRLEETCARSTSMMFTAVTATPGFSQAMEERVVFLATDFTPGELLSVFTVYMDNYTAVYLVSHGAAGVAAAACKASGSKNHLEELHFAQQRQTTLVRVLRELMDQMRLLMESATAYFLPTVQLQYLEVFSRAVEDMEGHVAHLTDAVPPLGRCLELLSSRVIASLRRYTYMDLVALLQLCAPLGRLVADAAISAAVQELIQREVGASREEAAELCVVLQQLPGLRAEHQRRIENFLLPKLRGRSAQAG
ncbi:uncharacterized protein Tco025E_07518 [Trypanosoma conorhini]|uniref:Mitochondrial RNA binding complex 1 subunit n=1 Tax=Trypanosoma conorhini TaxID=83891 RepID=A0A3R7KHI9_9TRYP|nr:uncharacterized protein Tco025E_07518 [Trypanosoma conorhini]RNF06609.1 hypothetical protein Tco025E_07518 [Trypanosoma conorhini]